MITFPPGETVAEVRDAFETAVRDAARAVPGWTGRLPQVEWLPMMATPGGDRSERRVHTDVRLLYRGDDRADAGGLAGAHLERYPLPAALRHAPTVGFGPRAGNLAGPDEWLDVDDFMRAVRSLTLLIARWCGLMREIRKEGRERHDRSPELLSGPHGRGQPRRRDVATVPRQSGRCSGGAAGWSRCCMGKRSRAPSSGRRSGRVWPTGKRGWRARAATRSTRNSRGSSTRFGSTVWNARVFRIVEPSQRIDTTSGAVEVRSSYLVPMTKVTRAEEIARRGQETIWPLLGWGGQNQQMLHGKNAQSAFVWTSVWPSLGEWEAGMARTGIPEFQAWFADWRDCVDFGGEREIFRIL